jgi:hypothetical protein
MLSAGVKPSATTFTALISAYGKRGMVSGNYINALLCHQVVSELATLGFCSFPFYFHVTTEDMLGDREYMHSKMRAATA